MNTPMMAGDAVQTARALMERYGLQAAAVAEERAAEARQAGGAEQFDHWRSVALAIAELRSARPAAR